jgi:cell division protein FtsQ
VPVAHWGEGDTHLVNGQGEVFEVADFDGADSTCRRCWAPRARRPRCWPCTARWPLVAPLDTTIDSLELEPRGHWHATLDSGAAIELGQGDEPCWRSASTQFATTAREVAGATSARWRTSRRPTCATGGYALRLRGVTTVQAADPRAKR